MNDNEQVITVVQNKAKTLLLLVLLSIVVLFFTVELILLKRLHVEIPYQVFVSAVGLLTGSFYFILSGLYGLITDRAVFIINKQGIIDKSFLSGSGLIKWEEIDTIHVYSFMRQVNIGIFPCNAKYFFSKKWPLTRLSAMLNMQFGLAPINIPQSLLSLPIDIFLSKMQELQGKHSVGYALIKKEGIKTKKRRFNYIAQTLIVIVLIAVSTCILFSFFTPSSRHFALQMHKNNDVLFFSSPNMGGYSFFIDKKWINAHNKEITDRFHKEARNDIFFTTKDKTYELWLSIYKNSKVSPDALTQLAKTSMLRELPAHQKVIRFIDEKVDIANAECILSSFYLKNAQVLSIVSIQSNDLSVVGYLSYDSKNLNLIRDLARVLESFKNSNPPK
jgi:hypothetical protein